MKNKFTKTFVLSLISLTSFSIVGCSNNEINEQEKETNQNKTIIFNVDEENFSIPLDNSKFDPTNVVSTFHRKFLGWSFDQNCTNIDIDSLVISYESIKDKFTSNDVINLYAVFETPIKLALNVEDKINEIELYKGETYQLTEPTKPGYDFSGWSFNSDLSTIDFVNKATISYSDIETKLDTNKSINLYAVFTTNTSNIKLFQYNSNDDMAEIHINTKNNLPIDDPSLIDPTKKKGKNGELDVYNYVNATISVSNCEINYQLADIPGKVKVRGNYTSTYDKKPIRIKFNEKQKMLGLNNDNPFKNWVLLAGWKDSSNLRDAVSYFLGNSLLAGDNLYSSDFRFVNVYLNDAYNGVYLLVEQQELNEGRINAPESKSSLDSEKTGYLLEFDGYYNNEPENQRFAISYNDVKTGNNGFTIQNDIMNDEQYNYISKVVQNTWKVIYDANKKSHSNLETSPYHTLDNNGDYVIDTSIKSAEEATSKVINIDSLIDMYIIHEICQDRDIGWSSFYMSLDASENGDNKLTFNAPWDFDYALGNNTFENAMLATIKSRTKMIEAGRMTRSGENYKLNKDTVLTKDDFKFENTSSLYCKATDNPWFIVFSSQQWLWNRILSKWTSAKEAKVFDRLLEMIEILSNKYTTQFEANYTKWPQSMGLKLNGYQPDVVKYFTTQKHASEYLSIWLNERINGLNTAFINKVNI